MLSCNFKLKHFFANRLSLGSKLIEASLVLNTAQDKTVEYGIVRVYVKSMRSVINNNYQQIILNS